MTFSEDVKELAAALVKVQRELRPAKRESTNPHFGSTYADLCAVMKACRLLLARHQIAVFQDASAGQDAGFWQVDISTRLVHAPSGQFYAGNLSLPALPDAQAIAKNVTYGRRIHLATMVGVVAESEDDDGNGAVAVAQETARVPGAMETTRLRVQEVLRTTKRKFQPFYRFRASDGNVYGGRDAAIEQVATQAFISGADIDVTWKQEWETRIVMAIEAVAPDQQTPEAPL